jgi:ABC-type Fe3+-siderophore transport system permease subunit
VRMVLSDHGTLQRACTALGPKTPARSRATIQRAAQVVGAVFLLVGVLGFIPGVTTGYDAMAFAGPRSRSCITSCICFSGLLAC